MKHLYISTAASRANQCTKCRWFFDRCTNRVALIANNIRSSKHAFELARHALIGHYGSENMVNSKVMSKLANKVTTAKRLGNKLFKK